MESFTISPVLSFFSSPFHTFVRFSSDYNFSLHFISFRYEREEYRCTLCSYACTIEKAFQRHLRAHARGTAPETRVSCAVCGADRSSEVDLSRHMRRHRDDRYFCCDICIFRTVQLKKVIISSFYFSFTVCTTKTRERKKEKTLLFSFLFSLLFSFVSSSINVRKIRSPNHSIYFISYFSFPFSFPSINVFKNTLVDRQFLFHFSFCSLYIYFPFSFRLAISI